MRIPHFSEVREAHSDAHLSNDQTFGQHLDQLREEFVREHAGAFINTHQALDFVAQRLPFLPVTEQAAVAKQLVEDADLRVNWPRAQNGSRQGLDAQQTRQRQEIVRETLENFVNEARAETLGVEDLARALNLQMAKPGGVKGAVDGAVLNLGTHVVILCDVPSIVAHQKIEGMKEHLGYVRREGSQLAFTGFLPKDDGYTQVQVKIDAEKSDGPLTILEHAAIQSLADTLGKALGGQLVSTRYLGSVGSEQTHEGVIARSFDRRRALADGSYIRVPEGEGKAHHSLVCGAPSSSSFTVGPANFHVLHYTQPTPYKNRLADGSSFQVLTHDGISTLQVQVPLRRGETAYATLPHQPSLEAARLQVQNVLALTNKIFGR